MYGPLYYGLISQMKWLVIVASHDGPATQKKEDSCYVITIR